MCIGYVIRVYYYIDSSRVQPNVNVDAVDIVVSATMRAMYQIY